MMIKNSSDLKYWHEKLNPDSYYFSRDTMRMFGDTMRNYGVRKTELNGVAVYELYRRKPVKYGLDSSHYFDMNTLDQILGE